MSIASAVVWCSKQTDGCAFKGLTHWVETSAQQANGPGKLTWPTLQPVEPLCSFVYVLFFFFSLSFFLLSVSFLNVICIIVSNIISCSFLGLLPPLLSSSSQLHLFINPLLFLPPLYLIPLSSFSSFSPTPLYSPYSSSFSIIILFHIFISIFFFFNWLCARAQVCLFYACVIY